LIPSPNLDDKTYKEIVSEAISLIPHYFPEWTNHNPSDPGVTLIELFSWMTEMVLYRLNKVPEKTYLALLELMGITLSPPQASRVLLNFYPVKTHKGEINLPREFQVSTGRSGGSESITYETEKRLVVKNNSLVACMSLAGTKVCDHIQIQGGFGSEGAQLFFAREEVERYLYFKSPAFQFLEEANEVCLKAGQELEILRFFDFQYWDGERWIDTGTEYKNVNTLHFSGPINIKAKTVNNSTGYFIRAKLKEFPDDIRSFEITGATTRLLFSGDGLAPDLCLFNSSSYSLIDLEKDFKPFQDKPVADDIFYLASKEVFSKTGARVFMNVLLNESVKPSFPADTLTMRYEYWDGRNWMLLGVSRPGLEMSESGEFLFRDETRAFCRSGVISFVCPEDLTEKEINGENRFWLRVRISVEDLGKGGGYDQSDSGKWKWHFSEHIVSPLISRIRLSYDDGHKPLDDLLVWSDFSTKSFKKEVSENQPAVLIKRSSDEQPFTCFGFSEKFPEGEASVYLHLADDVERPDFYEDEKAGPLKRQINLAWQYFKDGEWLRLNINDFTDSLHKSGFLDFQTPPDWKAEVNFGKELLWMRVVFENGSFESPPVLRQIYLNAVYGLNCRTYQNKVVASGSGSPFQQYDISGASILPGLVLEVREDVYPPQNEREIIETEEGSGAVRNEKDKNGNDEVWVRYHQVTNFHESSRISRHYMLDYAHSRLYFGDGLHGVIPPRGKNNIRLVHYRSGGGVRGNTGAHTIRILRESVPFLAGVDNPFPARGGADLEHLDNLKMRASGVLRSRNRAVTAEDFSCLSFEASSSVGRTLCLPKVNNRGEIVVIILPRRTHIDLKEKLMPSSELTRRVREYLEERKLVGTKLQVAGPLYRSVSLHIRLVFREEIVEIRSARESIDTVLRKAVHPLLGGNGNGWQFGEALQKEFIQRTLDRIHEIHHVEDIQFSDNQSGLSLEKITLRADELIYLDGLSIEDRRSEF